MLEIVLGWMFYVWKSSRFGFLVLVYFFRFMEYLFCDIEYLLDEILKYIERKVVVYIDGFLKKLVLI